MAEFSSSWIIIRCILLPVAILTLILWEYFGMFKIFGVAISFLIIIMIYLLIGVVIIYFFKKRKK